MSDERGSVNENEKAAGVLFITDMDAFISSSYKAGAAICA